jgi:hypothetical protein
VASAIRPKRYMHQAEPLLERLAESTAESAGVLGLDEAPEVADVEEASDLDGAALDPAGSGSAGRGRGRGRNGAGRNGRLAGSGSEELDAPHGAG